MAIHTLELGRTIFATQAFFEMHLMVQLDARGIDELGGIIKHEPLTAQVIAERLTQSIAKLPGQPKSWWQRWLKR